jgi:hypothetical protein
VTIVPSSAMKTLLALAMRFVPVFIRDFVLRAFAASDQADAGHDKQ